MSAVPPSSIGADAAVAAPPAKSAAPWRAAYAALAASALAVIPLYMHRPWGAALAWVAFVPLWWGVLRLAQAWPGRPQVVVAGVAAFGFAWYWLGFFWLNTTVAFHPAPPAGILAASALFGSMFLLATAPALALHRWLSRGGLPPTLAATLWPVGAGLLWAGTEHLRSLTDAGLPWLLASNALWPGNLRLLQLSTIGGAPMVSTLIIWWSAAVALAALAGSRAQRLGAVASAALAGALALAASLLWPLPSAPAGGTLLPVGLAQANTDQMDKWIVYAPETPPQRREQILQESAALNLRQVAQLGALARAQPPLAASGGATTTAAAAPALLVLSEGVFFDAGFVYQRPLHQALRQTLAATAPPGSTLLFGADSRESLQGYMAWRANSPGPASDQPAIAPAAQRPEVAPDGTTVSVEAEPVAYFNAAWLLDAARGLDTTQLYRKRHLVPFGESAPFIGDLPAFADLNMMISAITPAYGNGLLRTPHAIISTLICFESPFAQLVRPDIQQGAQLICVLTNDAWYNPEHTTRASRGPWSLLFRAPGLAAMARFGLDQHFAHTALRAIEFRRPAIVCANTGRSGVIDAAGHVTASLPIEREAVTLAAVGLPPPGAPTTPYTRWGGWFGPMCALGNLWWLVAATTRALLRRFK